MPHFICTGGCHGRSDEPGNCESAICKNYGNPLEECNCTDDRHDGAFDERYEKSE